MPLYRYKAVDKNGREVAEIREVPSPTALRRMLKERGLVLYHIEEVSPAEKGKGFSLKGFSFGRKISDEELSLLLYEIGLLLGRGVHITKIFEILSKQTENKIIQDSLMAVKIALQEGKSVADALATAGIFPDFLVEMARAGEEAGALDRIFLSASEYLEKQSQFKSKLFNSLIYPTIVIVVGFVAMVVIINFVVPTITRIYSQLGKELPLSTKMVIYFSKVSSTFFKILPFVAVAGFVFRKKLLPKERLDGLRLKIPFFSRVHLYSQYANWSNTLSLLLSGGLTLDKALEIANKTITNSLLKKRFDMLIDRVKEGKPLSEELKRLNLLPENAVQLISIGEETGQLDEMLGLVAEIYRKQTERLISLFLSYIEPLTLIILSVLIGFFVFATLLPIFNLNVR
ncbi:MAG: type II secretion system F family protein [Aquificae bacterium]|nr:type II secretion system F family protein [Aquificota bacterium]